MKKKAKIALQIAGFRTGMIEKMAAWTDVLKHPATTGVAGLLGGAGLGALGHHLYQKYKKKEQEEEPYLEGGWSQMQFTPQELQQQQLMAMYGQDPYSMYY